MNNNVRALHNDKYDICNELKNIYIKGFEFPEWSINLFHKYYTVLASKSKVYCNRNDDIKIVEKLVLQREPVNMGFQRRYHHKQMNDVFGWKTGYYGEHYDNTGKLAPNIAIYCQTLLKTGNTYKKCHILNSIGYAFDDKNQPDYDYFCNKHFNTCEELLQKKYFKIFEKIYQCAKDHKLGCVVMSLVGGGSFATKYTDSNGNGNDHFLKNVWCKVFNKFNSNSNSNIKTMFMGSSNTKIFQYLVNKYTDIGYFPECVSKIKLDDTLFVNAWDPWSMAGNGNNYDNSLDGHMGRHTMIALMCWSGSNQYLRLKKNYISI
jgi:hypothetical protein